MRDRPIIVLAGGKGTRLGELTHNMPKPMVLVEGKPFLLYLLLKLEQEGFTDIIISTGHKSQVIETYPWHRHLKSETRIRYKWDSELRGPMNAILDIFKAFDLEDAFVTNGDTYPKFSFPKTDLGFNLISTYNNTDIGFYYYNKGHFEEMDNGCIDIGTPEGIETFKEYIVNTLK